MRRLLLLFIGVGLLLSACSSRFKGENANNLAPVNATSRPYKIKGRWYYPQPHYEYNEMGIASWYGPGFHGNKTSTGERYDQHQISAAHKTLPLPCVALVTNLENGRMIKVKVNDRGPFVDGRIIDLSKRAAELLGVLNKGTAKVRVETLVEESITLASLSRKDDGTDIKVVAAPQSAIKVKELPASSRFALASLQKKPQRPAASVRKPVQLAKAPVEPPRAENVLQTSPQQFRQIYIQAGAFSQHTNATGLAAKLSRYGRSFVKQSHSQHSPLFRVRVGPFGTVDKADSTLSRLVEAGFKDAQIVVE